MSVHRWSKFWWQDWQREPSLRMCSPAARGVWMDMLAIMFDAEPQGHLLVNGRPPTYRQLGSVFGVPEKVASALIQELEDAGVFSRGEAGTIISRRMVRDNAASALGATEVRKKWGEAADTLTRSQRMTEARKKGRHTHEEWAGLRSVCGSKCLRCEIEEDLAVGGMMKDRIVPIYQGGSDAIDNLQPLCGLCTRQKGPECLDHRPPDWKKRLAKCLTPSHLMTTLEADSESEAEEEKKIIGSAAVPLPALVVDLAKIRREAGFSVPKPETGASPGDIQIAFDAWNVMARQCEAIPAMEFNSYRQQGISQVLMKRGLDGWRSLLARVQNSAFCNGAGEKGWRADIAFLFKDESQIGLIEGKYDDPAPRAPRAPALSPSQQSRITEIARLRARGELRSQRDGTDTQGMTIIEHEDFNHG